MAVRSGVAPFTCEGVGPRSRALIGGSGDVPGSSCQDANAHVGSEGV